MADGKGCSCSFALSAKADLDLVPQIKQSVADIMEQSGFGQRELLEVQLAVEEAWTNIFLHAYEGRDGIIGLRVEARKDILEIIIEDFGPPFDPTGHMAFQRDIHDEVPPQVGGWGIGLMRKLMDEMKYERLAGKNILRLIKKNKQKLE